MIRSRGVIPLCAAVVIAATWASLLTSPGSDEPALIRLERMGQAYGIEIVADDPDLPVTAPYGTIVGGAPGESARAYAELFIEEFSRYPVEFVRRSRLKRIVFCTRLAFEGQPRGAVPDFANDTLYLDVECGGTGSDYQRSTLHHDYFHMVDYRDDGEVYRDDAWAALNPPEFKYGTGGRFAQGDPLAGALVDGFRGFLTRYAMTGVEEDKAEVYSHLMVHPEAVESRAGADRVLLEKVSRIKGLLADFCPEMNPEFWRRNLRLRQ
jgi:hypothetical protein